MRTKILATPGSGYWSYPLAPEEQTARLQVAYQEESNYLRTVEEQLSSLLSEAESSSSPFFLLSIPHLLFRPPFPLFLARRFFHFGSDFAHNLFQASPEYLFFWDQLDNHYGCRPQIRINRHRQYEIWINQPS